MSFLDAVKSVYGNYVNFNGRARRSEYWWFVLFMFLVDIGFMILSAGTAAQGHGASISPVSMAISGGLGLFGLLSILPALAVTIRRLHDTGHSGWWIFLGLIPLIGTIILLIWYCTPGKAEPNKYGVSPINPVNVNVF